MTVMIFPDVVEKMIVAGLTVPSSTTLDDDIAKDMIAEVIWSGSLQIKRNEFVCADKGNEDKKKLPVTSRHVKLWGE
jgi:hypothetical protein